MRYLLSTFSVKTNRKEELKQDAWLEEYPYGMTESVNKKYKPIIIILTYGNIISNNGWQDLPT